MKIIHKNKTFSSSQIIILGFLAVILIGTFLLMLPFSTKGQGCASFMDSLFTATSAVCVTGLVVHDTATYWSQFGQAVILIMIQIGGMGVVTVAVAIAILSGRKIGLMQRSTMQEALAAPKMGGIVRLTGFILKATIAIEMIGAVLLSFVFVPQFGPEKGVWYSLFHSVSAFCNAGFDLMGIKERFSSLTSYMGQPLVNLVIMCLIIIGGIGFLTWDDIRVNKHHLAKYRMQSKIILSVTLILIVFPALYFYFCEFSRPEWSMLSGKEKILAAAFQSVTPRTAGFNTIDMTKLTESGQMITVILMIIGGSPGSTAGGIKTTTLAVFVISAIAVFNRKSQGQCFGRRIPQDAVVNAATILSMYLMLFVSGAIVISSVEGLPILTCLFETASAIGTVGLSLGVTPGLCTFSKVVLVCLMFLGRVGALTLVFAALSRKHANISKYPEEKITVG